MPNPVTGPNNDRSNFAQVNRIERACGVRFQDENKSGRTVTIRIALAQHVC